MAAIIALLPTCTTAQFFSHSIYPVRTVISARTSWRAIHHPVSYFFFTLGEERRCYIMEPSTSLSPAYVRGTIRATPGSRNAAASTNTWGIRETKPYSVPNPTAVNLRVFASPA